MGLLGGVLGGMSEGAWFGEMEALQQQSMMESLEEAKVNLAINRNNAMAQTSQGVGRD